MTKYLGWETAVSLLHAYEVLALEHKRALGRATGMEPNPPEPHPGVSYANGFAMLILNASIVEGTMRTILSERVKADLDSAIERGKRENRTEHDDPTRLLQNFLLDLETNGGWENLVGGSAVRYTGECMDQGVTPAVKEGIQVLFILRNVLAHGTALIQPKTKMPDDMKDEYPFKWQSKLQRVTVYLEQHFQRGDVFNNLAHPGAYEHFMDVTKAFFMEIETKHAPLPERACKTIELIKGYHWGYLNYTRG